MNDRCSSQYRWVSVGAIALSMLILSSAGLTAQAADESKGVKRVAFVSGRPSHRYAAHEHKAGCMLLAKLLEESQPNFQTVVYTGGWPKDSHALDGFDAVVMYSDGGDGHMVNRNLEQVQALMDRGVGLVCIHYAVEVPKGEVGNKFLDWIGGYFEVNWSVNPHWTAEFTDFPDHPVTRGVRPFAVNDEWYYHMRFPENMEGVTPILSAVPPASTLDRKPGPRSSNPAVRAMIGQPHHVAWARERPDGGRGFGFTGGHVHWNWGLESHRKVVLNAIVWAAHGEVPADGVSTRRLTLEDLEANQDYEQPADFDRAAIQKLLDEWNS